MKRLAWLALVAACGGSTPAPSAPPETPSSADATAPPAPPPDLDASPAPPSAPAASTPLASPPASPPSSSSSDTPDAGPSFDMPLVFRVYKDHADALRAACWDHSKSTEKAYIGKATIRLSPTGKVVSSATEGTDDTASACVDKQIKKWKFPPPNGTATIVLPIHLHRD